MSAKLVTHYQLKCLDFNQYDVLSIPGILDIFQDIAGMHSNSYGMSYEQMLEKDCVWVLLKAKYKVVKNVPLYANVKVETWPHEKSLVDFERETVISSNSGEPYIYGLSKWVILNAKTRKIIPAKHVEYNAETSNETHFDEKFDKLKDFDVNGLKVHKQKVEFTDTDHNGHTNNARYTYMILNALRLSKDEEIVEFQIDYINESHLDDIIDIYYKKEGNCFLLKAISKEKTIFISKVITK